MATISKDVGQRANKNVMYDGTSQIFAVYKDVVHNTYGYLHYF